MGKCRTSLGKSRRRNSINYARFQNIDPETALERINQKFKKRFEYIEEHAPKSMDKMSLAEMDALWNEAKGK